MKTLTIAALWLAATSIWANAQQSPQSSFEQALSQKLGEEINADLQVRAALMAERQKNAELQKEIDALKTERAKDPPK